MDKLREVINSFNNSITILNKSCYDKQGLLLFFTFIDQLGWLISSTEYSDGSDFRNWLETYCDLTQLRCTSTDIWNTRCSFLHMGTAEHKHFNSEKHFRLAFYQNIEFSEKELISEEKNYPNPTKLIDISVLYSCLNDGIEEFLQDIERDPILKSSVLSKCEKMNNLYSISK